MAFCSCCGSYNISTWLSQVSPYPARAPVRTAGPLTTHPHLTILQGGTHIDTSCDYGSQPSIAAAIAASGIARDKLWITSKLNVENCSTNMTQVSETMRVIELHNRQGLLTH